MKQDELDDLMDTLRQENLLCEFGEHTVHIAKLEQELADRKEGGVP